MIALPERFNDFARLMRMDRPVGTYLLLWPTLWALWFAAGGIPSIKNLIIFSLGVFLMRSAGCVINDYADRELDRHVKRTAERPITSGKVTPKEALLLFAGLCACAFILVLFTNQLTILLSLVAVLLAACYPFAKRYTHLPQVVLGAAFAWSVPMAFAAQANQLQPIIATLFVGVVSWTVAYDTFYAMVDREDDLKIGIKSTAILFGDMDLTIIAWLQAFTLVSLLLVGNHFDRGLIYYLGLIAATLLFVYQHRLAKGRSEAGFFKAFLNNNWVGACIFIGIGIDYQWPL